MEQYLLVIVGGAIGFLSSVGTLLVTRGIDRIGKIKIYCKRTSSQDYCWGFWGHKEYMSFLLPMDFEFSNTSNRAVLLRDVSIEIYREGTPLLRMKQGTGAIKRRAVNGAVESEEKFAFGGENSSYSFVLQPRSIQKQKCLFLLNANQEGMQELRFDEIRLSYFDEKDRRHCYPVAPVKGDWMRAEMDADCNWIRVK